MLGHECVYHDDVMGWMSNIRCHVYMHNRMWWDVCDMPCLDEC